MLIFCREPCNENVVVTVGKGPQPKQVFSIRKDAICSASPYFEAALNEQSLFIDSKTQEVSIDFTTPTVFGMFQNWALSRAYGGKIRDANGKLPPVPLWSTSGYSQADSKPLICRISPFELCLETRFAKSLGASNFSIAILPWEAH